MKQILRLKHWQLFCLIILPSAFTSPSPLQEIVRYFGLIILLFWVYSIGVLGHDKLKDLKLESEKLKFFKVNVIICPVTILIVHLFTLGDTEPEFTPMFIAVTPFALYFFFSLFYIIFFTSKVLSKIELKREVEFSDYSKNLLFIFVFIIGVWIIQPKVKRYIS